MANASAQTRSDFEEQRGNTLRTVVFVALGLLWVFALGFWATFVQFVFIGFVCDAFDHPIPFSVRDADLLRFSTFGGVGAIAVWAVTALVLYSRSSMLLPRLAGATRPTGDAHNRLATIVDRLNIVEPVLTVDQILVCEWSAAGAWAVGGSTQSGVIVVTRGLLDILDDEELFCVVAHEFAHLKNRDNVFVLQALAVVYLLVGLAF